MRDPCLRTSGVLRGHAGRKLAKDRTPQVGLGHRPLLFHPCFEATLVGNWQKIAHPKSDWVIVHYCFIALDNFLTFFTPVLAVFGALVAWAYQTGSARLGIVDLFACEIGTICRVAAVADSATQFVARFYQGPPTEANRLRARRPLPIKFDSEENYFTVFESSASELESLEAEVVTNITAFYTYMKVVRDSLRALADTSAQPAELNGAAGPGQCVGPWHRAVRDVLYMLFLAMESARGAVGDLIEYEPNEAEITVVILISELEAYRFLCSQYPDENETHHQRIALRETEYRQLVPELCERVEAGRKRAQIPGGNGSSESLHWEQAWSLLPELRKRYRAAIDQEVSKPSAVRVQAAHAN